MANSDPRLAILSQVLTASTDIYKENGRILALLEDKAQKAIVLAGIFLAAAFSFLRKDALADFWSLLGWFGFVLLGAAILCMLLSVVAGAKTLWVREMNMPPDPSRLLENVDLKLNAGLTPTMQENNLREQARIWNEGIVSQRQAIDGKAAFLKAAQWLLLVAIALVFALLALSIFVYGTEGNRASP